MEYWKTIKACDKKYKGLLTNYRFSKLSARGGVAKAKQKPQFLLAKYRERVSASTSSIKDDIDSMMWEEQAIEFWMTAAGGLYTRNKAQRRWDEMVANKDAYDYDQLGPNEERPLRLPIVVGTNLKKRNEHKREKDWPYHCRCLCLGSGCSDIICSGSMCIGSRCGGKMSVYLASPAPRAKPLLT